MRALLIDPSAQVTTNPEPFLIHGCSQATGEVLIAYQVNTHGCHQIGRYNATDGSYLGDWGLWTSANAQWLIIDATLEECLNTPSGYNMMVRASDPTGAIYVLYLALDGTLVASCQIATPGSTTGKWTPKYNNNPLYVPGQNPLDICKVTVGATSLTPATVTVTGLPAGAGIASFAYTTNNGICVLADNDPHTLYQLDGNTYLASQIYSDPDHHMRAMTFDDKRNALWITTDEGDLINYGFSGGSDATSGTNSNWLNIAIASISNTNPVVIQTKTPHGFAALDEAIISNTGTALDAQQGAVTVIDKTHFSLPIDGTTLGAMTGAGIASYVITAAMAGRTGPGNNYTSVQYASETDQLWTTLMVNSPGSTDYHPYVYYFNPDTFAATVLDPNGDGGQQSVTGGGLYPQLPSSHIFQPRVPKSGWFSSLGYNPNGFVAMSVLGPGTSGSGAHFVSGRILRWTPFGQAASPNANANVVRMYAPTYNEDSGYMYGVHSDNPATGEAIMCYQNNNGGSGSNYGYGQGASIIGRFNPTTGAYLGDWGDFGQSSAYEIADQVLTYDPDNQCFFVTAYDIHGTTYVIKIDANGHILSAVTTATLFSTTGNANLAFFTTRNRFTGDIWVPGPNGNIGLLNRSASTVSLLKNLPGTANTTSSLDGGPNGELWGIGVNSGFSSVMIVQVNTTTGALTTLWDASTISLQVYNIRYDDKRKVIWAYCSDGSLHAYNLSTTAVTAYQNFIQIPITSISNTNPAIVTTDRTHGFISTDQITFGNVMGMSGINGQTATCTYIDRTHFSVNIDATGYGIYTGGGTAALTGNFSDGYESPMSYDPYRDCMWFGCFCAIHPNGSGGTHPYLFQIDLTTMLASVWDPNQDGQGLSVTQTDMGSGFYGDTNPNVAILAQNYAQFAIAVPGVDNFLGLKPELIRIEFTTATIKLRRLGMFLMT